MRSWNLSAGMVRLRRVCQVGIKSSYPCGDPVDAVASGNGRRAGLAIVQELPSPAGDRVILEANFAKRRARSEEPTARKTHGPRFLSMRVLIQHARAQ